MSSYDILPLARLGCGQGWERQETDVHRDDKDKDGAQWGDSKDFVPVYIAPPKKPTDLPGMVVYTFNNST